MNHQEENFDHPPRTQEEKFNSSLERFGRELAKSNNLDEAFGIFLRFLAGRFDGWVMAE